MFSTFKMMSRSTNEDLKKLSFNELVQGFQEGVIDENKAIATIFVKLFPLILSISNKFPSLQNETKAEEALCSLERAMSKFSYKVKFTTFFTTCYTNCLRTLVTKSKTNSRMIWEHTCNIDDFYSLRNIKDVNAVVQLNTLIKDVLSSTILNTEEKRLCALVALGYEKPREQIEQLSKYTKVCSGTLYNQIFRIKRNIKEKLKKNNYELV